MTEDKLEIGACATTRPGWLCTDRNPAAPGVVCMDATRTFPYADASFCFVYSEHMIEHIPLAAARVMVAECFRVLKPGGVLRVVTPSIDFLVAIMHRQHQDYISWSAKTFCPGDPAFPAVVFNNFVRAWGHRFIYDLMTLADLISGAGFVDLDAPQLQESKHPELRNLASENRMPEGFLALESMVVEGTKPA